MRAGIVSKRIIQAGTAAHRSRDDRAVDNSVTSYKLSPEELAKLGPITPYKGPHKPPIRIPGKWNR